MQKKLVNIFIFFFLVILFFFFTFICLNVLNVSFVLDVKLIVNAIDENTKQIEQHINNLKEVNLILDEKLKSVNFYNLNIMKNYAEMRKQETIKNTEFFNNQNYTKDLFTDRYSRFLRSCLEWSNILSNICTKINLSFPFDLNNIYLNKDINRDLKLNIDNSWNINVFKDISNIWLSSFNEYLTKSLNIYSDLNKYKEYLYNFLNEEKDNFVFLSNKTNILEKKEESINSILEKNKELNTLFKSILNDNFCFQTTASLAEIEDESKKIIFGNLDIFYRNNPIISFDLLDKEKTDMLRNGFDVNYVVNNHFQQNEDYNEILVKYLKKHINFDPLVMKIEEKVQQFKKEYSDLFNFISLYESKLDIIDKINKLQYKNMELFFDLNKIKQNKLFNLIEDKNNKFNLLLDIEMEKWQNKNTEFIYIKNENEKLANILLNVKNEIENLKNTNINLTKEIDNLVNENLYLLNVKNENDNLTKEIENLQNENNILNLQTEFLIVQNSNLNFQTENINFENLKNENEKLKIQFVNLTKEIDNLKNENLNLLNVKKEMLNLVNENINLVNVNNENANLKKEMLNLVNENINLVNINNENENIKNINVNLTNEMLNLQKENLMLKNEMLNLENEKVIPVAAEILNNDNLEQENNEEIPVNNKFYNFIKDTINFINKGIIKIKSFFNRFSFI